MVAAKKVRRIGRDTFSSEAAGLADVLRTVEGADIVKELTHKLAKTLRIPRTLEELERRVAPVETLEYVLKAAAKGGRDCEIGGVRVSDEEPAYVVLARPRARIDAVALDIPPYPGAVSRGYLLGAAAKRAVDPAGLARALEDLLQVGLLQQIALTSRTRLYRWAAQREDAAPLPPILLDAQAEEDLSVILSFSQDSEKQRLADLRSSVAEHIDVQPDRGPVCRLRRGGAVILMHAEGEKWYCLSQTGRQARSWLDDAGSGGTLRIEGWRERR
ncbi:hypothetical protein [Amorphus sp. 3PC139-8]|uniref:hypothetical protein n=1 Tax=Amorphus sp. 3PC139-8 TaxID=2735676 RepID=UPI00345DA6AA